MAMTQRRRITFGFGLRGEVARLSRQVAELEEDVRECRRHHLRVAELTDIVQELLVPLSQRDEAKVEELLARYTEQLG
jgi:hypothetical protein